MISDLFKIIAKVIVSKFKRALGRIVGPFQSAFIKDGSISNNYIVAHEILHSFKNKKKLKLMGLKFDMASI